MIMIKMVIITNKTEIQSIINDFKFTTDYMDDNCKNAKFLSVQKINSEIAGIAFVGGIMNSYGIEINEKFQGKKLSATLFEEIIKECKKRKISFLTGVYKNTNIKSYKVHSKFGFLPVFSVYYNKREGREIVVIFPINKNGQFLKNIIKFFDTRVGNLIFCLLFSLMKSFLKQIIAMPSEKISKLNLIDSIKNFEKTDVTIKNMCLKDN